MDIETIKTNGQKMREMAYKFGNKYYDLLGDKIIYGKEIQEAIDECYKELIEEVSK
jgi:hypothetical protein